MITPNETDTSPNEVAFFVAGCTPGAAGVRIWQEYAFSRPIASFSSSARTVSPCPSTAACDSDRSTAMRPLVADLPNDRRPVGRSWPSHRPTEMVPQTDSPPECASASVQAGLDG